MRYYKCDGSYEFNQDCEFGWWLDDVKSNNSSDDEHEGDEYPYYKNSYFNSGKTTEKYSPVLVHTPAFVEHSQMGIEKYTETNTFDLKTVNKKKENEKKQGETVENFDDLEKLIKVIPFNTLKGHLLVSLMGASKNKTKSRDFLVEYLQTEPISELKKPSKLTKPLTWHNFDLLNKHFLSTFSLYNIYSKQSKTLIKELPFTNNPTERTKLKIPRKTNYLPSEFLQFSVETNNRRSEECIDLLCLNLKKLQFKVKELREEAILIRKDFEMQDKKTSSLICKIHRLSHEIRERNYLNEVILLLKGQPQDIQSDNWPFKMCLKNANLNLIV